LALDTTSFREVERNFLLPFMFAHTSVQFIMEEKIYKMSSVNFIIKISNGNSNSEEKV